MNFESSSRFVFFFSLVAVLFCFSVVFAQEGSDDDLFRDNVFSCSSFSSQDEVDRCYADLCVGKSAANCIGDIVYVVGSVDASLAMSVLEGLLENEYLVPDDENEYGFAQLIGQSVLQSGLQDVQNERVLIGDLFLSCTDDFHHGCYHGFFQSAYMVRQGSVDFEASNILDIAEEMNVVCDFLSADSLQGMCYRKMGHVFMKIIEYDFISALRTFCDSLGVGVQPYCWSGVFAENVDAVLYNNDLLAGSFDIGDGGDALFPCNAIDEKYKRSCYENHGPYLLYYFDSHDVAIEVCDYAEEGYAEICKDSVAGVNDIFDYEYDDIGDTDVEDYSIVSVEKPSSWIAKIINFVSSLFGS